MATDLLVLEGLHAHYGSSHVLHGISFALRQGQLLALLGRNGAGKSTTMLTLSGLVRASGGLINLHGVRIDKLPPESIARRGMRLVPQGRRIFSNLSVQENLEVAAQRRPIAIPWNLKRVYDVFPQLAARSDQRAGTLSGGEQQMLAIARALMGNPDVLLMDEPSEGLAPLIVQEVIQAIARLKREGLSIILVEQNFAVAKELADAFVVLNVGHVAYYGTAQEVQSRPELASQHLGVF